MTQLAQSLNKTFTDIIIKIFKRQTSACILVIGRRESGKTDFSFLITEILHYAQLITPFATNVRVHDSPFPIERITNLADLELWCKDTSGKKLFILDEAGKSLRRRTPMAGLNIKLLDNLQILRKYRLSIIMIAPHSKYIDSAALGSDILDAVFTKPNFRNPRVALYDDLMDGAELTFTNIPKTSIHFDTWDVAPFTLKGETQKPLFKEKDLEVCWEWSHGKTAKALGLHSMQLSRIVKKFVKETMDRDSHISQ